MTDKELDAINEKVAKRLGWKSIHTNLCMNSNPPYSCESCGCNKLPDYSRDIKAAFELGEKYYIAVIPLKTGYLASTKDLPAEEGECLELWYTSSCMTRGECNCGACEIADTASLAICLAFLKLEEK